MGDPKADGTVRAAPPKPPRRVGTFTAGIAMVAVGLCMTASLFFPAADFSLAVKLSPVLLVSLGVEILLAAGRPDKLRYDWAGLLLCCVIAAAALAFYAAAWSMLSFPEYYCCR